MLDNVSFAVKESSSIGTKGMTQSKMIE